MPHLFGFLQIVLESLPLSSSGHLAIIGLKESFVVERMVHGPTVLVIMFYFWSEWWQFLKNLYHRSWQYSLQKIAFLIGLIVCADTITVIIYYALKNLALYVPLWFGLMITGSLLISLKFLAMHGRPKKVTITSVLWLGFIQGCARLPGVSRLGSTYVVGRWLGYTPQQSLRISCALQVLLFTGGFLQGLLGLSNVSDDTVMQLFSYSFLMVILCAMVIAYLLLFCVERLMINNKIWYLGIYLIALAFLKKFFF